MNKCNEVTEVVSFEEDGFSIEYNGEIIKLSYIGDGESAQEIILPDGCKLIYTVLEDT